MARVAGEVPSEAVGPVRGGKPDLSDAGVFPLARRGDPLAFGGGFEADPGQSLGGPFDQRGVAHGQAASAVGNVVEQIAPKQ